MEPFPTVEAIGKILSALEEWRTNFNDQAMIEETTSTDLEHVELLET